MPCLERAHAVDLDRALQRAALDLRARCRRRSTPEQVGEDPHHRRPHHLEREVEEHQRQLVHRAAEADDLAHDVGLVVERVVEELLHPDLGDAGAHAADQRREDVERPARVDARHEHRGVAGRRTPARPRRVPARARSRGAAAGRTTSTPRWRPRRGRRAGRRTPRRAGCRRSRCRRRRRRRRPSADAIRCRRWRHAERLDERQLAGVLADLVRVRHHHPTSSRSRCAATARIAGRPTLPVPHTTTRYVMGGMLRGRQSGMASHHWHHQSPPTRMRSFGCQQYEISAVFSR